MTNRRAKIAAGATVLGLGALGGVALGTNPGVPAAGQAHVAGAGTSSVVTSTSGAASLPVSQPGPAAAAREPIVTRASGSGASGLTALDD